MALTDKITAIADAIRAKTGSSNTYTLADMPAAIAGIVTGSDIDWGYQLEAYSGSFTPNVNSIGFYMKDMPENYDTRLFAIIVWATEQSRDAGINRAVITKQGISYSFNAICYGKITSTSVGETAYIRTGGVSFSGSSSSVWVSVVNSSDTGFMTFAINRDYNYLCLLKAN